MAGILGRYEAWGRLSQGGMSEVWLARHEALAMPAIVKTIRPEVARAVPEAESMLVATARLAARLASPSVVRVLDAGSAELEPGAGAVPCVIEEYVDGLDLAELDRRRREALGRALPLWAVAELVAESAGGLQAAHQGGIVHRDVKPANLFADPHGHVKVGDFGVAVAARGHAKGQRDRPAGTPHFMAPEQLAGEPCDRRSDVFSLGATAFALRYGQPPWADTGELRGVAPPRFPPARTPEEAYFQHVLEQAMARRPEARLATAAHVETAMRTLARGIRPALPCAKLGAGIYQIGETRIAIEVGDIAAIECDAIVNSGYHDMTMRTGVGEALRLRGGDALEDLAMAGSQRALGDCVMTTAGSLSCRAVLHAVGAWREVSCIARATWRALLAAESAGFTTIAMPAIGTGKGRVSLASCADTLASVIRMHVSLGGSRLREIRIVLYDGPSLEAFEDVVAGVLLGTERTTEEHDATCAAEEWSAATQFASDRR